MKRTRDYSIISLLIAILLFGNLIMGIEKNIDSEIVRPTDLNYHLEERAHEPSVTDESA